MQCLIKKFSICGKPKSMKKLQEQLNASFSNVIFIKKTLIDKSSRRILLNKKTILPLPIDLKNYNANK